MKGEFQEITKPQSNAEWKDTVTYSWSNVNVFAQPDKGPFKGKHALKTEKQILFDGW